MIDIKIFKYFYCKQNVTGRWIYDKGYTIGEDEQQAVDKIMKEHNEDGQIQTIKEVNVVHINQYND